MDSKFYQIIMFLLSTLSIRAQSPKGVEPLQKLAQLLDETFKPL